MFVRWLSNDSVIMLGFFRLLDDLGYRAYFIRSHFHGSSRIEAVWYTPQNWRYKAPTWMDGWMDGWSRAPMADRLHSDASWLDGPSKCEMRRKEWRIVIHVIPLSSLNAASSMDPSGRSVRPCGSVHLSVRASVSASVSQCVIALQMLFIRKLKKNHF